VDFDIGHNNRESLKGFSVGKIIYRLTRAERRLYTHQPLIIFRWGTSHPSMTVFVYFEKTMFTEIKLFSCSKYKCFWRWSYFVHLFFNIF